MSVRGRQARTGASSPSRIRLRSIGVVLLAWFAFGACTPPPADPSATTLACGWPRVAASAGSGERVVLVGDSILAAFELPPGSLGTTGAPFAAARVAQNGMRASADTSVGSTFEHWNRGLIRRDAVDSGPITNQTIADLNALNQPVAHTVVALGTNDAALIANGTRTLQQVADQILASMNQALFTSTGCLIMVMPAVHTFTQWNDDLVDVRNAIRFVARAKNNELGQNRVHVADFHQVWVDAGSPESWFQGNTGQDPHLTGDGYGRYLDLVFLSTAAAKNGSLGC